MDQGLVSVIIPVYNTEGYLRTCVESILNQTYENFELLLIDDGSKDSSPAICDEFAQADPRVVVIHRENEGPSATRNKGIEEAKGEFIVFVDSDDLIQEDMLGKMVEVLTRYQTDLALCGYSRFRDDWKQNYRISPYSLVIFQTQQELASVYNKPSTNMFGISIWAKMYRAEIIKENNIRFQEDINYEEDCCFNLAYFHHVQTTAVLRDYFYQYRQMDQSLSKTYRPESFGFLVNGYRQRKAFMEELEMRNGGADVVFMMVIKTTFSKIFNSSLTKAEKLKEYEGVMAFEESQAVCVQSIRSKARLTRLLAKAVIHQDARCVHWLLTLQKAADTAKRPLRKLKWMCKKLLRRLKK